MDNLLMSIKEAAEFSGLTKQTLRVWIKQGSPDWGSAVGKKGSKKLKYIIIRNRFQNYFRGETK